MLDCNKIFFYHEPNFFLFAGRLGSFKFKTGSIVYCKFLFGVLHLVQSLLANVFSYYNVLVIPSSFMVKFSFLVSCKDIGKLMLSTKLRLFTVLAANIISSITRGWNKRLRFVGIGYRVYSFLNVMVFKLGYNHYIIYLLPYELRLFFTGRKRRNLVLFGLNKELLSIICNYIIFLRLPNIYTGKGVRLRGVTFKKKEGKKSQF